MTTTAQQLALARQNLLDLTLRSRLLNYTPSKQATRIDQALQMMIAKGEVVCEGGIVRAALGRSR